MIDGSEFAGKVAVVTGAGQGMGKAVSQRLSSGGAKLVINDVSAESAERTVAGLVKAGGEAVAAPGDVTSKTDVDRMVRTAVDRYGGVHILVNNAGVLRPTHVIDIEEDEWDLVVDVNLKGTYLCSRAVLLTLREQGWGRIVSFSSTGGFM